jgi:hypothetical protein
VTLYTSNCKNTRITISVLFLSRTEYPHMSSICISLKNSCSLNVVSWQIQLRATSVNYVTLIYSVPLQEIIDIQLFQKSLFLWNLELPSHQRCLLSEPVVSHFISFYSLSMFFTEIISEIKVNFLLCNEMEWSLLGAWLFSFPGSILHENTSITCLKRKWMETIDITVHNCVLFNSVTRPTLWN